MLGDRSHHSLAVAHHSCSADPHAGHLMVVHNSAGIVVVEDHSFADIAAVTGRSSADIAVVAAHHSPVEASI